MQPDYDRDVSDVEVTPLVVISQTFPARPSSIPDIRDFVRKCLAQSPLSEEDTKSVGATVSQALLDAAGPTGTIQVSFRIFPDHVEVDVLRSHPLGASTSGVDSLVSMLQDEATRGQVMPGGAAPSFSDWMSTALRKHGLTMEAAARQLGVSVRTVSRWVGGTTEPRLRDLQRIRQLLGDMPFP